MTRTRLLRPPPPEVERSQIAPHELRHFKSLNWHNITSQEGRLRGDIFNHGNVGTGKTSWMEGVQAAFVLGEPRMTWNSAASQGLTLAEQGEGRDLVTIALRYMNGRFQRNWGVSYFAVELTDADAGDPYTLGIGVSVASPKSRPNKWGFIVRKHIGDVRFADERGRPLDHHPFEEANGRENVYAVGEYIRAVGTLLFGSYEDYEKVMDLWELGKSYNKMVRKASDFTSLFRNILQPPNKDDYKQALSHLAEIKKLSREIKDREAARDRLHDIQRQVGVVRRLRGALVRYDYFEKYDQHKGLQRQRARLQEDIGRGRTEQAKAEVEAQRLGAERDLAQATVRDLEATGADELMGRRQSLFELVGQQRNRIAEQARTVELCRTRLDEAENEVKQKWRRFELLRNEVGRSIDQVATRHPALPEAAAAALAALRAAADSVSPESEALPAGVPEAVRRFRVALTERLRKLGNEAARAENEMKLLSQVLASVNAETAELRQSAEVQPVPGLHDITSAVRDEVRVLYRIIIPRAGRLAETALLESFLPPYVLAAIVPRRAADTQRIRHHVIREKRAPQFRVVDAETLASARKSEVAEDSVLRCIDPDSSDPVAYSYLAREYGDVRLLDEGADRGALVRVLWRNGDVYDGHAYRLETVKSVPEFIGPDSRKRAYEKRLEVLSRRTRELESELARFTATASTAQEGIASLSQADIELSDILDRADLGDSLAKSARARALRQARQEEFDRQSRTLRLQHEELGKTERRLADIDSRIRDTGAAETFAKLDKARGEFTKLAEVAKSSEFEAQHLARDLAKMADLLNQLAVQEERAEEAAREFLPKLRQLASEETPAFPSVEEYLRATRFHELSHERLGRNRQETNDGIVKARIELGSLVDSLRSELPLDYHEQENQVFEAGTGRALPEVIGRFDAMLREDDKRRAELYSVFNAQIIVGNMVRRLRRDQQAMDELIDELNVFLVDNPVGRRAYRIQPSPDNHEPEIAQMRKYVEESREEAKMDALALLIRSHLEKMDPAESVVPPIFDYRYWYTFGVKPVAARTGEEIEVGRAVNSGGEQAIPNHLICFALFHFLYERVNAKLRIVFLDEAFEKISAQEINELLGIARRLGLTVIASSNKLEPAPVEDGTFTTQFFRVNEFEDTIIERFIREESTEAPVAER